MQTLEQQLAHATEEEIKIVSLAFDNERQNKTVWLFPKIIFVAHKKRNAVTCLLLAPAPVLWRFGGH